jgi:hypothetical protein
MSGGRLPRVMTLPPSYRPAGLHRRGRGLPGAARRGRGRTTVTPPFHLGISHPNRDSQYKMNRVSYSEGAPSHRHVRRPAQRAQRHALPHRHPVEGLRARAGDEPPRCDGRTRIPSPPHRLSKDEKEEYTIRISAYEREERENGSPPQPTSTPPSSTASTRWSSSRCRSSRSGRRSRSCTSTCSSDPRRGPAPRARPHRRCGLRPLPLVPTLSQAH